MGNKPESLLPQELIENKIYLIRGEKVMLDRDLAELYGVETRALNQAVLRNRNRFPSDFMFRLNLKEFSGLISQFVISNGRGGIRKMPYVFTENGVAMLSSVLNSPRAIAVNIQIMRTFTKIRKLLASHQEILRRLDQLEDGQGQHGEQIVRIFAVIQSLLDLPVTLKRKSKPIGFMPPGK
jgi:urease gamma subunit